MKKTEQVIFYLCDGEQEACTKRFCHKTIGNCRHACKHTKDIHHAKNFHLESNDELRQVFFEKEDQNVELDNSEKMSFAEYLISMLGQERAEEILSMTRHEKENRLIIITGRQGPTGKSTLRRILRAHGYWVLEPFESIEVVLNEELQHPVADFISLVD